MADLDAGNETKQEHLQIMGSKLGPIYHELYNEVVSLHAKWAEYRKLFFKSKNQIDLLNESASFFFYVIERVLRENVLMHIARLTDPPTQGRFHNLTLLLLPNLVTDRQLSGDLDSLISKSLDQCRFARRLRDKMLAHNDLSIVTDAKAKPLPGVSRQNIEDALASIRKILNRLHCAYFEKTEVGFDHFIARFDAESLVHHLAVAAKYKERKRRRFLQGKPLPEDLDSDPDI